MKRPTIEDTRIKGGMSIGGNSVNVYEYSRLQDKYIDYLLKENGKLEQYVDYAMDSPCHADILIKIASE